MEHVRELIKPSVDDLINYFDNDVVESSNTVAESGNTVGEWLEDANIIHEDLCENDVQACLNGQSINEVRNFHENQLNIQESTNNWNNNNQDTNEIDVNENSFNFVNNAEYTYVNNNGVQKLQEKENIYKVSATGILRKRKSTLLKAISSSLNNDCDIEDINKRSKLRKTKEYTRLPQFKVLTESKIELVEMMKEDIKAKSEIEMQILNMQLQKEELEVQLLEKELLIKNYILEREIKKNVPNA